MKLEPINCNGAWFDRLTVKRACADWIFATDASIREEREEMIAEIIKKGNWRSTFFGSGRRIEITREEAIKKLDTAERWSLYTDWELPYFRSQNSRSKVTALEMLCSTPSVDDKVFVDADTMSIIVGYMK